MQNRKLRTTSDVASWRLCAGCGACFWACRQNAIILVDRPDQGIRPVTDISKCQLCGDCVKVCPGMEVSHGDFCEGIIPELSTAWGPILEIWEGYATDPEIRYKGSSGGAATALALYCVEKEQMGGVLQTAENPEKPCQNIAVLSRNRVDLLACTGSRYLPAAPCAKLEAIKSAESACAFVGKPCDVAALRKSQAYDPALNTKIGVTIGVFCAGTPSTRGTHILLEALGVRPDDVRELRYRGLGWPGLTTVKLSNPRQAERSMTYEESWGNVLSRHVQFRCRLCPDSTAEFADIACGDPWHRPREPSDPGQSLILVRTQRGRRILGGAIGEGYLVLHRVQPSVLAQSQKPLYNKRCHLWGRLLAMRMMLVPVPHFAGFSLLSNWRRLPWVAKLRSVGGTFRRIIARRWLVPMKPLKVAVRKYSTSARTCPIVGEPVSNKS